MKFNKKLKSVLSVICLIAVLFSGFAGCGSDGFDEATTEIIETTLENQILENETDDINDISEIEKTEENTSEKETQKVNKPESVGDDNSKAVLSEIPEYSGTPYVVINDNVPSFNKYELTTKGYETYASLDSLGRCGGAVASCGREIMPKPGEERGSISAVKPSGWVQAQYDCVSGKYLYNRCHLIGWQLSAENANKRNLITGTRYMNTEGMLPFENMVADYIKETNNHVAYRITPIYDGNDLVAKGVQMEAYSIEDEGEGICFNVFCYNVQPGVEIDYTTGRSQAEGGVAINPDSAENQSSWMDVMDDKKFNVVAGDYVLNTNTKKIHRPHCHNINKMNESNKQRYNGSIDDLYSQGYTTCGNCF